MTEDDIHRDVQVIVDDLLSKDEPQPETIRAMGRLVAQLLVDMHRIADAQE
jgi:hypothetical protein